MSLLVQDTIERRLGAKPGCRAAALPLEYIAGHF